MEWQKIKNYLIFVSLMEVQCWIRHLNSSAILKWNLLRAQFASTHLVRLLKTFLRCDIYLLRCNIYLLRCNIYLLCCEFYLLRCEFYLLCCDIYLLRCDLYLLRCDFYFLRCDFFVVADPCGPPYKDQKCSIYSRKIKSYRSLTIAEVSA